MGSPIHALVLCTLITVTTVLIKLGQKNAIHPRQFAFVLYGISLAVFLRDLRPDRISWANSLPLHLCDINGLLIAIAIHTQNRPARCIVHYWGLGLSSLALFFPVLNAGPIHSDFWLYWIEHGAIVIGAIYDVVVNRFRPTWRDWEMAVGLITAYVMVITPLDAYFNWNYGYLGANAEAQRSMIGLFGQWPARIPLLWFTGVGLMTLLRLRVTYHPGTVTQSHTQLRFPNLIAVSPRSKAA